MRRLAWGLALGVLAGTAVAQAQGTGEIAIGSSWLQHDGNRDAFLTQTGLDSGLWLDRLHLDLRDKITRFDRFELDISGFGAEPWQRAALKVDWDRTWSLRVDYNRREEFFSLPTSQFGPRRDDWAISRWTASLEYDNWKPARLRLDLRDVRRSGSVTSPFYGLGLPYVGRTTLDERVQEAGLSIETRTLPVKIFFEHDIARYVRKNRAQPANNGQPVGTTDPDVLAVLTTPGEDSSSVPTTRLAAIYGNDRFEFAANGLYRRDRLDANRADFAGFALDGGKVGQVGIVDEIMGSADTDTKLADVRLGFAATSALSFRLHGHWADVATDTSAIGDRIIRFSGTGGQVDLPVALDDHGFVDRTDKDLAGEVDLHHGPFGLILGYHDGSRKMAWRHGAEYDRLDATRDARGLTATASYNPSRTLALSAGWESSTFDRYVIRTDPESVRRVWAKCSVKPTTGLDLSAYVGRDERENPTRVAGLDQPTSNAGMQAAISGSSGAWLAVSVDWFKFGSDLSTQSWAPKLVQGVSTYATNLLSTSVRGSFPITSSVRCEAGALRLEDRADTTPFVSSSFDVTISFPVVKELEVGVFANQWKYDLGNLDDLDYNVKRFGFTLRRRF